MRFHQKDRFRYPCQWLLLSRRRGEAGLTAFIENNIMKNPVSSFRAPAWKPLALASAISALFATSAHAQTEEIKTLAPVVVTASRIEQSQAEAIPTTTVITKEMIRERQATDVLTLLRTEAGVEISQMGNAIGVASLFMRGSESKHTLILIDGIPIRDTTELGTAAAMQNILPDQIERIEIVRGNVSAIYGSGAVGGVVQIFTKQGADGTKVNASAEYGSRGTNKVTSGISGKKGDTRFMLSVARFETDGFSAMNTRQNPSENPDKDGGRNESVAAGISHEWSHGHEFGVRTYANNARYEYDGGALTTSKEDADTRQRTLAAFSKNRMTSNWLSMLTFSELETRRHMTSVGGTWDYDDRYKSDSSVMQWANEIMLTPNWMMTGGVEGADERAETQSYGSTNLKRSRNSSSVYGGVNGKIGVHSLQANVRNDHVEDTDGDTTWYLGYGYNLTSSWKLIASTSTGFLAPTMFQLYDGTYGNANLKAEHSRSKEAGVQYASGPTLIRTVFFETNTSDMIVGDPGNSYKYANISEASNHGMEVSATSRVMGIDTRASLTLQNPKNEVTDKQLVRRTKTLATLAVTKPFGALRVGGDVQYVGHRPDIANELPSYILANLNARYQINKEISVYGRLENIFDRNYQTAYGYNEAGRGFFAGVEWRQ